MHNILHRRDVLEISLEHVDQRSCWCAGLTEFIFIQQTRRVRIKYSIVSLSVCVTFPVTSSQPLEIAIVSFGLLSLYEKTKLNIYTFNSERKLSAGGYVGTPSHTGCYPTLLAQSNIAPARCSFAALLLEVLIMLLLKRQIQLLHIVHSQAEIYQLFYKYHFKFPQLCQTCKKSFCDCFSYVH